VETLLRALPEKYRQVVVLFYLEQKAYSEVAAMLGLPMGTVKTLLFRARKELVKIGARSLRQIRETEPGTPRAAVAPPAMNAIRDLLYEL